MLINTTVIDAECKLPSNLDHGKKKKERERDRRREREREREWERKGERRKIN